MILAYLPATAVGYFLQRKLVWRSTKQIHIEGSKYIFASATQATANAVLLGIFCDNFKFDRLFTQAALTVFFVFVSYLIHRFWTFRVTK